MKKERSKTNISELDTVKWLRLYWRGIKENSIWWKITVVIAAIAVSVFSFIILHGKIPSSNIAKCCVTLSFCVLLIFLPFRSPVRSCHWDYRLIFIAAYSYMIYSRLNTRYFLGLEDAYSFTDDWTMMCFSVTFLFVLVLQLNLILHIYYDKNNKIAVKIYEMMNKYSLFSRAKGRNSRKIKRILIVNTLLFLIGLVFIFTSRYLDSGFSHMDLEAIIFTIRFAKGSYSTDVRDTIIRMLLTIIAMTAVFIFMIYHKERAEKLVSASPDHKKKIELNVADASKWTTYFFAGFVFIVGTIMLGNSLKLVTFVKRNLSKTTIYEDHYVEPTADIIHFPEKKKNLIYIYLESYENTFTSFENGGNQPTDLMPEIYELEKNNINFSHRSGVGGQSVFFPAIRYTMGSAIAQTSGVPLTSVIKLDPSAMADEMSTLLGPLKRLEDILNDGGYNQMYINGNDTNFAGYNRYVGRYEKSEIYDLINAQNDGRLPEDYQHPWGFEDGLLFPIVKDKIEELAAKDEPFYVATFTIDTHSAEGGFRCKLCDPEIKNDYAAAINCSSRQVNDFINWLSEKPYWKDTVVIFVGDHPAELCVDGVRFEEDNYLRTTCNCIINSEKTPVNEKNRTFCAMDMFPTTLSAIGCDIDGDRLGLGTDLFSDTPTLCEEMGADKFVEEVQKKSEYYDNTFLASEKN